MQIYLEDSFKVTCLCRECLHGMYVDVRNRHRAECEPPEALCCPSVVQWWKSTHHILHFCRSTDGSICCCLHSTWMRKEQKVQIYLFLAKSAQSSKVQVPGYSTSHLWGNVNKIFFCCLGRRRVSTLLTLAQKAGTGKALRWNTPFMPQK